MKLIILIASICFTGVAFAYQTIEIPRTDGSSLRLYLETPNKSNYPVVFLIHGSVCSSAFPMFQATAPILIANGVAVATLEKYGINQNTESCPREYIENNTVHGRISDHLLALVYLRNQLNSWNKKVAWAGGSEGGQIAALTAPLVPETAMVVMMASGGGLTMSEELPIAFERALRRQGATNEQIQKQKTEIEEQYKLIKADPTPNKEWLSDGKLARNTYKYWDSILWVKAMPLLETLDVPMLLVHGTEDTSCPIESANILNSRFKTLGKANLTYKVYEGLEHNWTDLNGIPHVQEVLNDTFIWIFQNLGIKPSTPLKSL